MTVAFGALTFAAPWVLAALIVLPVIWWLLRVNPPAPRRLTFPPVRLLLDLPRREETPAKTPLWLVLLRLLLATLIILALAHPLLNPSAQLQGSGPLVLVVDDGWAAAPGWRARVTAMDSLIDRAEREGRPVVVVPTAPRTASADGVRATGLLRAVEARDMIQSLTPKPWTVDRAAAAAAIEALDIPGSAHVVWLSDGVVAAAAGESVGEAVDEAARLGQRLQELGTLTVIEDEAVARSHLLVPPELDGSALRARVRRPAGGDAAPLWVRASGEDGRLLVRQELTFPGDSREASAALDLPSDLANRVTRLEIEGEAGAGAVVLIDERWRRRPVGLVSGSALETAQPLLGDLYYLSRALGPFAELHQGDIEALLGRELAVLVLADVGQVVGDSRDRLERWIADGGMLVRFAGPRLAESVDDLVPVTLRVGGGRSLGGALSWEEPMPLAPFEPSSPFFGLELPIEVVVERQVLAEPSLDLATKTWARLADGTPLVTSEARGRGRVVLFHTTANAAWSNLALSGLFVDMMRRILDMSQGIEAEEAAATLPALRVLDGFGRLVPPPPDAVPISAGRIGELLPGPHRPPGYYGDGNQRRALNLGAGIDTLVTIPDLPAGVVRASFQAPRERDLMPWLLGIAALIAFVDLIVSLGMRGLIPARQAAAGAAVLALAAALTMHAPPGLAADGLDEAMAIASANETRLAYFRTGDPEVDRVSRAGLFGLGMILHRRTAIEPGPPMGVDPETDELVFYPLIYWPVIDDQPPLSDAAIAKLDRYLKAGGMVLFDTRDEAPADRVGREFASPVDSRLGALLAGLNVPTLVRVPEDHALTRTFYLLDSFPGRWTGGGVWVERHEGGVNDGVSSIIIGGNDWATAWALDDNLVPLYPVVPGGERQREVAFRFGVNVAMYALTGNYKADQVHLPIILERLGLRGRGSDLGN